LDPLREVQAYCWGSLVDPRTKELKTKDRPKAVFLLLNPFDEFWELARSGFNQSSGSYLARFL